MGNTTTKFRGDVDVVLKDYLREVSDEDYAKFLEQAENNGDLDAEEYQDKNKLLADLETFSVPLRTAIYERLKESGQPY